MNISLLTSVCLFTFALGWNYEDTVSWAGECASTTDQSPVDITTTTVSPTSDSTRMKMVLLGQTGSKLVENTGNYLRIKGNFGYIEFGTGDSMRAFDAREVDFHVPSEHTINGVSFPMEMQVVLYAQDKYILRHDANMGFLSAIFKRGGESYFMNTLHAWQFPGNGNTFLLPNTSNINAREVVFDTDHYYYYNGTATNPDYGCVSALWFIIQDIKEAADWQINAISSLFPMNDSRQIQTSWTPTIYYSARTMLEIALLSLITLSSL